LKSLCDIINHAQRCVMVLKEINKITSKTVRVEPTLFYLQSEQ